MLTRRFILSGLVAAPAVIAAERLMKVRGIILPGDDEFYSFPLALYDDGRLLEEFTRYRSIADMVSLKEMFPPAFR